MVKIDITEHLPQFTACGVIVVDGQWAAIDPYCYADTGLKRPVPCVDEASARATATRLSSQVQPWEARLAAPELWRKLTEPCPTCKGNGAVLDRKTTGERWPRHCPDCAGGRQVVTLTATCSHCGGSGLEPDLAANAGPMDLLPVCEAGCDHGVVTLGRFTIRLLPVRDPYHPMPAGASWLVVNRDGRCYIIDADGAARGGNLVLDPLPQPGQWAVQFMPLP